MNKLRIALLTDGVTPFVTGGMQRHSANLAKYFTLNGVGVTLVHCVKFDEKLPNHNEVNIELFGPSSEKKIFNIVTLRFPKAGKIPGHYIRNSYKYSKTVFESIDFSNIDFVYAKGFAGWYYMEQKKKGIVLPPIGVKFHGYEMFQVLPTATQKIKARILRKATVWNNENADYIFSYGGKITELIRNEFEFPRENIWDFTSGIDETWLSDIDSKNNENVKFVFVGRNEVRKGIKELSHVIKNLLPTYDFQFHFIGPIPKIERIEHANVVYHGEVKTQKDICAILDEMDVMVCPSHSEGMPNVILEGMARGLAIVASNVGAVEMLVDDSNGKLIQAINIRELENAMKAFVKMDKGVLQLKGEVSKTKVANDYLWSNLIQRITDKISYSIK